MAIHQKDINTQQKEVIHTFETWKKIKSNWMMFVLWGLKFNSFLFL